ncbi:MAG: hypothetical protein INF50_02510 [Rhodobacter sp.]|nr:hypothetical protein [Rhodobacter sp.]
MTAVTTWHILSPVRDGGGVTMTRAAVICVGAILALSACGKGPEAALQPMDPGREKVIVEGVEFQTFLRDGPPGERLTPMGAVPTAGLGVIVRRADGAELANSEGRIAKAAAEKGCNAAGGTFNRAVLGRYEGAGTWVFDGVCT